MYVIKLKGFDRYYSNELPTIHPTMWFKGQKKAQRFRSPHMATAFISLKHFKDVEVIEANNSYRIN